ncbi:unnamed protein product [Dovyalis caffra]|uniref:Uncharacterized protein n=1 Tax=Dovyalis caffra TaxID=77055 RepID=A0AAV1SSA0_9ROSI|nr:unnamed protein product [Dovyalis caffra]
MGTKHNSTRFKTQRPLSIFIVLYLCCFFYILGAWQKSGFGIAVQMTKQTDWNIFTDLNFETHHNDVKIVEPSQPKAKVFKPCHVKYTDYTPCQEQDQGIVPLKRKNGIVLFQQPKGGGTMFPQVADILDEKKRVGYVLCTTGQS